MIVKYIYDVVYDTLELLEEGGHTYSMDANHIYKDMVDQGKITNYSFVLNKDTLTRTTTITYASVEAYQEHVSRFMAIDDNTVIPGRRVTNQYLEDEFGVKSYG
jgi:hypothetical protein